VFYNLFTTSLLQSESQNHEIFLKSDNYLFNLGNHLFGLVSYIYDAKISERKNRINLTVEV